MMTFAVPYKRILAVFLPVVVLDASSERRWSSTMAGWWNKAPTPPSWLNPASTQSSTTPNSPIRRPPGWSRRQPEAN
jgi:hypothetical protein